MDRSQRMVVHYLYLAFLLLVDIWFFKSIILCHCNSDSPNVSLIIFFTILNILFGIKEVILLENGIEKNYRFNFIINIIGLLTCGPFITFISMLASSLVYLPINQFRRIRRLDFGGILLNMLSLTISFNIMSLVFFQLNGKVFEPNFPYNVFAIIAAAVAGFAANTFIISLWIILYDLKTSLLNLVRKEFLWLLKYDLWQSIYAILIVNTIRLYFGDIYNQYTHSTNSIGAGDFAILAGIILVAAVFYYPISERLAGFNLLVSFNRQNVDLTLLSEKLRQNNKKVIRAFISMLEKRDPYTCGHSERVAFYSKMAAREMGLDELKCEMLEMAALLHDIGKMGVDINIINKEGKLTDEEYNEIKKHPEYGVEILEKIYKVNNQNQDDEFKMICDIANSHHERYDGRGYPKGLKGEEITLEARIIGAADALDAMTSDRSYRKGMPFELAMEELKKGSGTQFCPKVVEAMLNCMDKRSLKIESDAELFKHLSVFS